MSDTPQPAIAKAMLHLEARNPGTEIQIFDSKLNRVARSFGSMQQDFAAGIYQIVYRTGSASSESLISLRAGEQYNQTSVGPEFLAPGPVPGTSAALPEHEEALRRLTQPRPFSSDSFGRVLVFVRTLRDEKGGLHAALTSGLSLHDSEGKLVADFEGGLSERGPGWAAVSIDVAAGGYSLRAKRSGASFTSDQALWLPTGWQSVVIVPVQNGEAAVDLASVHTICAAEDWEAACRDGESALAVETILASLRQGRRTVGRGQVSTSGRANPMLTILAAHSVLLAKEPDWRLFDELVEALRTGYRGHPDVVGLWAIGYEMRRRQDPEVALNDNTLIDCGFEPVAWPPMLAAGYRGLLQFDARHPALGLIAAYSVAERAAALGPHNGLWSAWQPLPANAPVAEPDTNRSLLVRAVRAGVDQAVESIGAARQYATDTYFDLTNTDVAARRWGRLKHTLAADAAGAERVLRFLSEKVEISDVRTLTEFLQRLDPVELSLRTGVPVRTVKELVDAARTASATSPEPLTVQAWLFFEDLQRYACSAAVRRYLNGIDLASVAATADVPEKDLTKVVQSILASLSTEVSWSELLQRGVDRLDTRPLKYARQLLTKLDRTWISANTGLPPHLIDNGLLFIESVLRELDDRATRRLRAKLTALANHATQFAAQEYFAKLAIERVSADAKLPFARTHKAVMAVSASLPTADQESPARAKRLKAEILQRHKGGVVGQFFQAYGRRVGEESRPS